MKLFLFIYYRVDAPDLYRQVFAKDLEEAREKFRRQCGNWVIKYPKENLAIYELSENLNDTQK